MVMHGSLYILTNMVDPCEQSLLKIQLWTKHSQHHIIHILSWLQIKMKLQFILCVNVLILATDYIQLFDGIVVTFPIYIFPFLSSWNLLDVEERDQNGSRHEKPRERCDVITSVLQPVVVAKMALAALLANLMTHEGKSIFIRIHWS